MKKLESNLPMIPRQGGRAFRTEEEMRLMIEEYFAYCKETEIPPLLVGLSQWMGICKSALYRYIKGDFDTDLNRFSKILELAKDYTEHDKIINGLSGKYNASLTKFVLENNYGWSEKKAVEIEQKGTVKHEDVTDATLRAPLTPEQAHRAWQDAVKQAIKEST